MYKILLCWRYLRTRYIALASIISVMLGVATMIVVNSVMAGFTHEMHERLHGILSDVVVESHSLAGFFDPEWHMEQILDVAGQHIEAMTPTVHVPAMLTLNYGGNSVIRPVTLIGIDPSTQGTVSDFSTYLQHPDNRQEMSFSLRENGYDARDHQTEDRAVERPAMEKAGWGWRRERIELEREWQSMQSRYRAPLVADQPGFGSKNQAPGETRITKADGNPHTTAGNEIADSAAAATAGGAGAAAIPTNPFDAARPNEGETFDPAMEQHTGVVLGIALANFRDRDGSERFLALPGDDVKLTFPTAGTPPRAIDNSFTIVDFYESKMSEMDASYVFVPLDKLQRDRGMLDPSTGIGYATSIQIKLRPGVDGNMVRDLLREHFAPEIYSVVTWRDKQGPLLAAVQMETAILNVLLFLIIAVAGFGILAIFFMIVVEKTRDVGILKSLGASGRGVMGIFLGYGLSLGVVGSGVGMVLGLLFVVNINGIADLLSKLTGHEVFDPSIYYFYRIPTQIDPATVTWIVLGALGIAVLASVLPARRAARLHPVESLRYE